MQAPAHRHIVQFLDETMTTTDFFIAMEHCARGDLWEILSKHERGHFDECETATMIRGVALAVQYLHEVIGVAHRDLSVENILVTAENVCKISDFGLSTDANKLTNTKVGKEYYMAPEVAAGKWYDPKKADVWSLGIVLFVMLTGSPLVKIADPSDRVFRAIEMYGPASVLTALGMHGRASLCMLDLLCQMLVVDPKRRITLSDVVRFLEEWELDG
ncbi:TPA: hypothetical protein N0F65_001668 [Lagenidium giganteum]|uniref:Protein kinase domain-containing protein n=1 Tax=Lagenidium giganteum TaxID=4803 RepID=A0AAV2Z0A0_9STRA|nr:TPA: hypothetical protein N0F65_001668 [Lagenidium giganteum]